MAYIVLIPMFMVTFVACMWAFGDLGLPKYLLAFCVALLSVLAVVRQPELIRSLEIPYQALAITMLMIGLIWICMHVHK